MPQIDLVHGACPEALRDIEANTFHALVTDPPAGPVLTLDQGSEGLGNYHSYSGDLGDNVPRIGAHKGDVEAHRLARQVFWDGIRPIWAEVYRVLRPGAFGVVWAHPVTSHWTAMSLEDEGFEVRNTLHVDYGSGALRGSSKEHVPPELRGWNSKVATTTEHWILVRKPPEGTLLDNYRAWGAGFLNVRGVTDDKVATNLLRFDRISRKERAGNPHPTPKSIAQMRRLVRLVTPPEGRILDPFGGSGSTGEAALIEGFSALLVEPVDEYFLFCQNRMRKVDPSAHRPLLSDDVFDLFG